MGKRKVSFNQFVKEHAEGFAAFEKFMGWQPFPPKPTTLAAGLRRSDSQLPGWAKELKRSPFIALLSRGT